MEVRFASNKLEKVLTDERLLKKRFNIKEATTIMIRMLEFDNARNLTEISHNPPVHRHKLRDNYANCWAVNFSKKDRIIFKPIGEYDENDLRTITSVEIVELTDYH